MQWQEVCEHPSLRELPFKIETNEKGEIVMNAVKVIHSLYQGESSIDYARCYRAGKPCLNALSKREKERGWRMLHGRPWKRSR